MISGPSLENLPKTLASRRSGTTEVALVWSRSSGRAAVVVDDPATGEHFELAVGPGDNPLDVFEHPYAYAGRLAA